MQLAGPSGSTVRAACTSLLVPLMAVLFAACVAAPAPPPAAVASTPEATVTAATDLLPEGPLDDGDVGDLLRRAVCWHDDPTLAASCLPPSAETVAAIEAMGRSGDPRFIAPLVDMRWLELGWRRPVQQALEQLTGQHVEEARAWYEWAATQDLPLPEGYATWKGRLLSFVDPAFGDLLDDGRAYEVRPDLLVWTGVGVDEVTPLHEPRFVHRLEERYLDGDDVVFGVVVDGVAHAYPRRIVSWHHIVSDSIEGTSVTLVFCPSCGGAVAFDPRAAGATHVFGNSGLAYDARTLLFDEATRSLWDPVTGRPVAGPLLGAGIELGTYPVVTTTWSDWAAAHPNTSVLDLDTGQVRDYSKAAGMRAELASAEPAFPLAHPLDQRLPAKEAVLGLVVEGETRAYPVERVRQRGIVHDSVGGVPLVLLSEGAGTAVRVYRAGELEVTSLRMVGADLVADGEDGGDGTRWFVQEETLVSAIDGREYSAVPGIVTYWATWSGTHPETSLWEG